MTAEPTVVARLALQILEAIVRFLKRRRESKAEQTARHRQAVESVLAAVLETERYVFDRSGGGERDSEREGRLAALWSKAALDVRAVDRRLSRIALLESFGWASPKLAADPRSEAVTGQLELARRQCQWLLEHWESLETPR